MSILVLGSAVVDKIVNINSLPNSGDDICAYSEDIVIGGCAYNVSNILRNLEVSHDLVVPVGSGIYGNSIEKQLIEDGNKIFIKDENQDNGYCLCLVEKNGERTFITVPGVEYTFRKEWLDSLDTDKYDSVYISGYELEGESGEVIVNFLEENKNLRLYFAPGPRISCLNKNILDRIYKLKPIIHMNDKEAKEYINKSDLKECILEVYMKTMNTVFVTVGAKGCLYTEDGSIVLIDGYKTEVVDTIGAGDSHIASIIGANTMGFDTKSSLKIANKIASKVVATKGPKLDNLKFDKKEYLKCN